MTLYSGQYLLQSDSGMETIEHKHPSQQDITFKMTGAGQNDYGIAQNSVQSERRMSYAANSSYIEPESVSGFSSGNQIPKIFNTVESGGSSNPVITDKTVGTGIKLRTRQNLSQASAINSTSQGSAPRRIRLQKKMQVGPVQCHLPQNLKDNYISPKKESAEIEVRYY